ncbi:MAG: DUF2808 domain-containing protein [Calothrix sp. C42_A2020_038]|nr:DUF2808 domain-containing protein [Calothrix sp. C42_A2020_038]
MRVGYLFGAVLFSILATSDSMYLSQISQAVEVRGKVYFNQPPRLVEAATTYNDVFFWGATYYFTIDVPNNAVEPLQKITLNQREGVDNIRFDLNNTYAFEGTRRRKGQKLGLQDVTSQGKQSVSVIFNPPVPPGKTITIAMKPLQNPTVPGVYLFGVTAFPTGEQSHGQFLGYGRLQFYHRML